MKIYYRTQLWSLVILFIFSISVATSGNHVLTLKSHNFSQVLKEEPLVLVNFYTPWCGHCQTLHPVLQGVANDLVYENAQAKVAEIDASEDEIDALLDKEGINGFPTLMLYKEGIKFDEFRGHRTERDILQYLKRKNSPILTYIKSQFELVPHLSFIEGIDNYDNSVLSIVVGFFHKHHITAVTGEPSVDKDRLQLLKTVGLYYDLSLFFYTDSEELLQQFDIKEDSVLVFTGDKKDSYYKILFDEVSDEKSLTQRIILHSLPLSIPFIPETQPLLDALPVRTHALAFYDSSSESDDQFLDTLVLVAPKYKGKLMIIEVPSEEYQLLHYFNIRVSDLPQLVLVDLQDEHNPMNFRFTDFLFEKHQIHPNLEESTRDAHYFDKTLMRMKRVTKDETEEQLYYFNANYLDEFFDRYLKGRLTRSLISEEPIAAAALNAQFSYQNDGQALPMENIVGSQLFDKLFSESRDKDVLLYAHAPWCIHCKATEAIILENAILLQNDPHFQIYRIDGSKNEITLDLSSDYFSQIGGLAGANDGDSKRLLLSGFPTIYFFPRKGTHEDRRRKPVEFLGERATETLFRFIRDERMASATGLEGKADSVDEDIHYTQDIYQNTEDHHEQEQSDNGDFHFEGLATHEEQMDEVSNDAEEIHDHHVEASTEEGHLATSDAELGDAHQPEEREIEDLHDFLVHHQIASSDSEESSPKEEF